jgi:hypothetical protein
MYLFTKRQVYSQILSKMPQFLWLVETLDDHVNPFRVNLSKPLKRKKEQCTKGRERKAKKDILYDRKHQERIRKKNDSDTGN